MRAFAFVIFAVAALAADKKSAPVSDSNDTVELTAFAHVDKQSVAAALGKDPGFEMVVLDVTVRPLLENEVAVWRDDFVLISRKDGQKSQPLAPTQIAGKGGLVVSSTGVSSRGMGSPVNNRGPIWGGIPGTGDRPRRLGGDDDVTAAPAETKATIDNNTSKTEDPLLASLKAKVLTETKTKEPVSGQLYFILDGKHKRKDLELIYKTGSERIILDFEK
jgi:hypothetical protein